MLFAEPQLNLSKITTRREHLQIKKCNFANDMPFWRFIDVTNIIDVENNSKITGFVKKHPIIVNLLAVCVAFIVLCTIAMIGLDIFTEHGKYKIVPDVKRLQTSDAVARIEEAGFRCEITDSTYNENFPLGAVIDQDPKSGSEAKSLRTIYLSVNASSPRLVALPNLNDMSVRQGESTLIGLGFRNVTITRVSSPFKDLILSITADGRQITSGTKLPLSARINLTVGDGEEPKPDTDSLELVETDEFDLDF